MVAAASDAGAAPTGELSPAPGLSGPVGPALDRGARVHDGFYLRIATGFGVYDERVESAANPVAMRR